MGPKGMRYFARIQLLIACALVTSTAWAASPCDGVSRSLTDERRTALAPGIARQLEASFGRPVAKVDVLQSFQFGGWDIIYVDTHESDEAFLFYAHDPLTSRYITMWSGAAMWNEEQEIRKWTVDNAPGIPLKLATCFAWHVTKDRDK